MKKTTKVVLGSVMTMAMCASLIAGSTLALFSSEDSVNLAITSGKVEVEASVAEGSFKTYLATDDGSGYTYKENAGGGTTTGTLGLDGSSYSYKEGNLTLTNIAGGEGISFNLVITNKSTISVKYQVRVTATNDGEKDLASQLRASFDFENTDTSASFDVTKMTDEGGTPMSATSTFASNWSDPLAAPSSGITEGTTVATVPVGIWLPTTVASDYEEAKCTLKIAVLAYQGNAHVENPPTEPNTVPIYNATELCAFSLNEAAMNMNVALMDNIYLGGEPVAHRMAKRSAYVVADAVPFAGGTLAFKPIGSAETPFSGTFDGHGYTIYGLNATGTNAGLFGVTKNATIKDVKLANATVTAEENGKAGALVAEAKGTLTVTNVAVTDSTVKAAAEASGTTVGALVGSVSEGGTVTVTDVDVQMNESDDELGEGSNNNALVGQGTVEYPEGSETTLEFDLNDGFVEKITNPGKDETKWYEVSSKAGLEYFAKTVNGTTGEEGATAKDYKGETVKLAKDINLSSIDNWDPINKFGGKFDGQNYTISDLKIIKGSGDGVGLFGSTTSGSSIKNLTVKNVTIQAPNSASVGAIVGSAISSMENDHVVGDIDIGGSKWVGGLVGYGYCNFTSCSVVQSGGRGIYIETYNGFAVGGIIGRISGSINDCTVKANIECTKNFAYIGALAGGQLGDGGSFTYNNNTFDATILSKATDNVYKYRVGALIGNVGISEESPTVFKGNKGKIVVTATVSPNGRGLVDNEKAAGVTVADDNTVEVIWNGFGKGEDGKWHIGGEAAAVALGTFRDMVNNGMTFEGETVVLDSDVDLQNVEWTPIGTSSNPFKGTFDGTKNGTEKYTISNLTYENNEQSNVGFFGIVNGTVKNIVFSKANITAKGQCGILAGTIAGGTVSGITIQDGNVTASGTGTAANNVGGLAGSGHGTIKDITINKTNVSTPSAMSGGIVGEGYATFSDITVSECTVKGNTKVGGVIGQWQEDSNQMTRVTVSDSTAYGRQSVGMLVGFLEYGNKTFDTCSIENCTIESPGDLQWAGGFIGMANIPTSEEKISFNACKIDAGKELTFVGDMIKTVGGFIGGAQFNISVTHDVTFTFSGGTTCNIILRYANPLHLPNPLQNSGVFVGDFSGLKQDAKFEFGEECTGAGYIGSKDSGNHLNNVFGNQGENSVSGNFPTLS